MTYWHLIVGIAALGASIFLAYRHVFRPMARVRDLARNLARGEPTGGYVPCGLGAFREIISCLEKIDSRMAELHRVAHVDEFSLRAILNTMAEGVLVVGFNRNVEIANKAFRDMFSLQGEQIGRPVFGLVRDPDMAGMLRRALEDGTEGRSEISMDDMPNSQGTRRRFQINVTPLIGSDKKPGGVIAVVHDISRVKQLEDMRTEFVANVSHELRTPLSVFHGYIETLLDNPDMSGDDLHRIIRVLKRHSDRLNSLVEDLMALTRLESERCDLRRCDIAIEPFLERIESDWRKTYAKRPCSLRVKCQDGLPPIDADPLRLEQVFYNLLDNALKYSEPETVVEMGARQADGNEVEFYVRDQGIGIPSDKLENVFQRFYRVDRGRSREMGGTGLGLSIVKHIILQHGGRVWAESEAGKGACIIFRLRSSGATSSNGKESQDRAHRPTAPAGDVLPA